MSMITRPRPGRLALMSMGDALAETWRAVRRRDRLIPQVPVAIVPGPAAACAWMTDWSMPVLEITTGTVADGPEAMLGWLLHQAAHAIAQAREDTITRYHGEIFRSAASSLRLMVSQPRNDMARRNFGWSVTALPAETAGEYGVQLQRLALALASWEPPAPRPSASGPNGAAAECACPRKIRIRAGNAAEVLEAEPIVCTTCGQPFRVPA